MSKKRNNKNNKKNNNKKFHLADTLTKSAAYALKNFVSDMMRDRYFSHRVFYPVMYQNKTYKSKDVIDVDTEFYLFKGEDVQVTSRAINAIIISNSVLVPKHDNPLTLEEMTYPKNKNIVFKRAKTFLMMLGDSNLYNFVISAMVRSARVGDDEIYEVQKRFSDLVKGHKPVNSQLDVDALANTKISKDIKKNIRYLNDIYKNAREKEITDALNFLQHMGDRRTIVTDFVYNSLTTDQLQHMGGGVNEYSGDNTTLKALEELQAFTNDRHIDKLVVDYSGQFAKGLKSFYDENFGKKASIPFFNDDRVIKERVIRSATKVAELTKNYIKTSVFDCWRSLCQGSKDSDTFFKNIMKHIVVDVTQGTKTSREIFDTYGTFSSFYKTHSKDDIYSIIWNLLKSDIDYFNMLNRSKADSKLSDKLIKSKEVITKQLRLKIYDAINDDIYQTFTDDMKKAIDIHNIQNEANRIYTNMTAGKPLPSFSGVARRAIESLIVGAKKIIDQSSLDSVSKYIVNNVYSLMIYNEVLIKLINDVDKIYSDLINYSHVLDNPNSYTSMNAIDTSKTEFENKINIFKHVSESFIVILDDMSKYLDRIGSTNTSYHGMVNAKIYAIMAAAKDIDKNVKDLKAFFSRKNAFDTNTLVNLQDTDTVMRIYYTSFLLPFMQEFLSYAIVDNMVSKISVNSKVLSKDILGLSNTLTQSNVGVLTFEKESFDELAEMFGTFKGDTFMGIRYNSMDDIVYQMNNAFGIRYFNLFIIDRNTTHMYLNQVGDPYIFKGTKTNISTKDLEDNYEYLSGSHGLYNKLIKDNKNNNKNNNNYKKR